MQPGFPAAMTPPPGYDPTVQILVGLCVVALILLIRIGRARKVRRVRIERMWIGPTIIFGLAAYVLYLFPPPPSPVVYAALALGAGIGVGVGWLRGRLTKITINLETHELSSQTTPWGILILIAVVAARMGLRYVFRDDMEERRLTAAFTDGSLLFVCGMVAGRRLEILLRCLKLLREAKEAKAKGAVVPAEITEDHA